MPRSHMYVRRHSSPCETPGRTSRGGVSRKPMRGVTRIVKIPREYLDVIQLGNILFSVLYQFENGLRLAIHHYLAECYGLDWWKTSLQAQLPTIFKYEDDQR